MVISHNSLVSRVEANIV